MAADFTFRQRWPVMCDRWSCWSRCIWTGSWCLQGGQSLTVQRQQLEELYLAHPDSMSILLDHGLLNPNLGLPQGPANFTLLWYTSCSAQVFHVCVCGLCIPKKNCVRMFYRRFSVGIREKLLRWLFPKAELCPLLDSAGTILQRCMVTHTTNSQSKVSAHVQTSLHQKSKENLDQSLVFGFGDLWWATVQTVPNCLSQGVGVLGWLVVGEGLPSVRVLPVRHCQKHCSAFNLWLTPGDMGNTCCAWFYPQMWQNCNSCPVLTGP